MPDMEEKVSDLRRDGFVFFRDFFPAAQVAEAERQLTRWYEVDRKDREARRVKQEKYHGEAGTSILTATKHLLIDVYGRSPELDQMVERVLTDPLTASVLRRMGGKSLKFRGYNIRRMTGNPDPGPSFPRRSALPHEWHRDSPGEMGIGILLTDIPEGGNAGTALLPGSHLFPYCPRWNTLFHSRYRATLPYSGIPFFSRVAPFNHLLARSVLGPRREAAGKRGDLFFFFNERLARALSQREWPAIHAHAPGHVSDRFPVPRRGGPAPGRRAGRAAAGRAPGRFDGSAGEHGGATRSSTGCWKTASGPGRLACSGWRVWSAGWPITSACAAMPCATGCGRADRLTSALALVGPGRQVGSGGGDRRDGSVEVTGRLIRRQPRREHRRCGRHRRADKRR